MICDEERLVAFVNGLLSEADEQAFDEHLLDCEGCWQAINQERLGRLVLERLREPASPGLADRVIFAVRLASDSSAHRPLRTDGRGPRRRGVGQVRVRTGRLVAAGVLVLAILGGVLGWALQGRGVIDPPQISRVASMMSPAVANSATLRHGERLRIGGQFLTVRSYRVEGHVVLLATSSHPFPMPAGVHLLAGSSPAAWMATRGGLAMYGVNRPTGRASMFLVAAMPMAELPQVAARLHLI